MTQDETSEPPVHGSLPDLTFETSPHETTNIEYARSPTADGHNIVFARYKAEVVEHESQRVAHVLTVPNDGTMPESLTALCGQQFPQDVLELLPPWAGMPCLNCTLNMPTSHEIEP